jgi:hypothetical protein
MKTGTRNTAIDSFLRSFAFSVRENPSPHNAELLVLVAVLYDRRATYEEDILAHDRSYVEYRQQVKYRFVPGVY